MTNASIELGGKAGTLRCLARRPRARRPRQARRGEDRRRRQGRRREAASLPRPAVPRSSARAHRRAGRQPGQADRQALGRAELQGHRPGRARDGADRGRLRGAGVAAAERARARRQRRRGQPGCERRAHFARLRGAAKRRRRPLEPQARPRQAGLERSISPPSPAASPARPSPARPISTSAAPRRASPFRAAPAAYRCRLCSACWWRGIARRRPRRCWARSAPAPRRSGRRAASRSARSSRPKARSAQGQHAFPRLRRQGARRHADRCGRQGRAFRHRSQRPSVRRELGCFGQPRAARQRRRACRARRSEGRQAGRSFQERHRIGARQRSLRSRLQRSGRGLEPSRPGRRLERGGRAVAGRRRSPVAVLGAVAWRRRDGRQEDHQGRQGRDRGGSEGRAREDHQGHLSICAGQIRLRGEERHASPRSGDAVEHGRRDQDQWLCRACQPQARQRMGR